MTEYVYVLRFCTHEGRSFTVEGARAAEPGHTEQDLIESALQHYTPQIGIDWRDATVTSFTYPS